MRRIGRLGRGIVHAEGWSEAFVSNHQTTRLAHAEARGRGGQQPEDQMPETRFGPQRAQEAQAWGAPR
jgi:hypothetical protein